MSGAANAGNAAANTAGAAFSMTASDHNASAIAQSLVDQMFLGGPQPCPPPSRAADAAADAADAASS